MDILVFNFSVLGLEPLGWLGVECVSKSIIRVVLKADPSRWVPLSMLFGKPFLGISPDLFIYSLSFETQIITF